MDLKSTVSEVRLSGFKSLVHLEFSDLGKYTQSHKALVSSYA